jgi:hypothetical protein
MKSFKKPDHSKYKQHQPGALHTAIKGSINELRACSHLLALGYEVFRNVSPSGKGDIVAWEHGRTPIVIDVKAITTGVYVRKDGEERQFTAMNKSKYPGVITIGVIEGGDVVCDELHKI